jgi:hypothetical protein
MVRDPRAVAFSWGRAKQVQDKSRDSGLLRRVGMVRSTVVWQVYNRVIGRTVKAAAGTGHYLRLPYERLAADPAATVDQIIGFLGEQPRSRPVWDRNEVDLGLSHTASGNPDRFRTGRTSIRLDGEWASAMPWWRRAAVTLLAAPTLAHMGYGWRG